MSGAGVAVRDAATDSLTFAFADAAAERCGLARLGVVTGTDGERRGSALAVLFAGREPVAALARGDLPVPAGADWSDLDVDGLRVRTAAPGDPTQRTASAGTGTHWEVEWAASDGQGFTLAFEAVGAPATLAPDAPAARAGGMAGADAPCRVRGTVRTAGRSVEVDGLGQQSRAWGNPDWSRIELARTVAAWTPAASAAFLAVRPAGARHHDEEAAWAALWEGEQPMAVADGRLSTSYDAAGHPFRAALELWPEGEDAWPRHGAGQVLCGTSLDLGALRLDCGFFRWHLEGREGVGRYDVLRRAAAG